MKPIFSLGLLLLHCLFSTARAQDNPITSPSPTIPVSMTPEMSAASVSSVFYALKTSAPQQPGNGPVAGDAGSSASTSDSNAGASGSDGGSVSISRGGIIAIIAIAVSVCIIGAVSAVLFYLAKKRDWQVRQSIRRSARKVATALTPRRTTFPKDVHSRKGLTKIDEVPSPRGSKPADVEKANPKLMAFEMSEPPPSKGSKWAKKFRR
ncbi:hypothetical protein LZ554_001515 [Drepanopeziza brunnea f. sp. 'monogermtubi']|nr:hypothetical protein LZ554_001515 [Drepanopeziza brunnea f. sp. 'monogermtubi']